MYHGAPVINRKAMFWWVRIDRISAGLVGAQIWILWHQTGLIVVSTNGLFVSTKRRERWACTYTGRSDEIHYFTVRPDLIVLSIVYYWVFGTLFVLTGSSACHGDSSTITIKRDLLFHTVRPVGVFHVQHFVHGLLQNFDDGIKTPFDRLQVFFVTRPHR